MTREWHSGVERAVRTENAQKTQRERSATHHGSELTLDEGRYARARIVGIARVLEEREEVLAEHLVP